MNKCSCKLDNVQLLNASGIAGSNINKFFLSRLFQNSLLYTDKPFPSLHFKLKDSTFSSFLQVSV